jgi:histidyl-tRNA synthetase
MAIARVRGTEDFLDLTLHNFVLDQVEKHLQIYNYSEIQTPILEHTSLFVRSLGAETDVVSKEMYTFQTSGEDSICLRPEATSSGVRAYVENRVEKAPWKVYTYGPMFRHERPQKGRWRQFSQINIEAYASNSIAQDAYFIKMLDALFTEILKLETYVIKLNFLGCSEDRKAHKQSLLEFLETKITEICETCTTRKDKNTLRVFDCKNETCKSLYTKAPKLLDHLCTACSSEWKELTNILQMLSVSFVIDTALVRGLDYYNKTVF